MPRGAIAKRSSRTVPGGGGPGVATPLLAFSNVAAMAAYDTTLFVDGAEAEVQSLAGLFLLDKTSALAVTPTTIVNATGGGQWLRQDIASLRWQLQTQWYMAFTSGDDEADGTITRPLKTWNELAIRVGEGPQLNTNIAFQEDSPENVLYDFSSPGTVEIVGVTSNVFTGTISGAQQANPATPVAAQITAAALPVSWTASGLVGRIAVLTSGASNGRAFVISADLGAKTARITQPSGANPIISYPFANGDTFDTQSLVRLSGVWQIESVPGKLFGSFLELNGWIISKGDPLFSTCEVIISTASGSGRPRWVGCRVDDSVVTESAEIYAFACSMTGSTNGSSVVVGPLGMASLEETLVEGPAAGPAGTTGILCDELTRLRILTYVGIFNVEDALRVGGQARIDSIDARIFGSGVTQLGIGLGANADLNYTNAFRPAITAPVVQVNIGGMITTYALLPKLNLGNGATAIEDSGTIAIVDVFKRLTVDMNTAVGPTASAVVISQAITVDGTRDIQYLVTWGVFALGGPTQGVIELYIDGVLMNTGPVYGPAGIAAVIVGGALQWKSGSQGSARLAAGAHTITVQWSQLGAAAQMYCRPVTQVNGGEHMDLSIRELVNDW